MSDLLEGQVELDPTLDFIAGTVAGMASLTVGFPFDTVKVRFQNPTTAAKYHSTLHAVATIVREEKFIGLYKGITSPLATVALMNGLVFASYRFFMKIQLEHSQAIPTLAQITLAGAGSGIVSSIITTPTELIKIRQQSSLIPTSTHAVALQIFREAGLGGLYRGITATALRDCGYGAYFLAYEATLRYFASRPTEASPRPTGQNGPSWPALLIAGGLAGICTLSYHCAVVVMLIHGFPSWVASDVPLRCRQNSYARNSESSCLKDAWDRIPGFESHHAPPGETRSTTRRQSVPVHDVHDYPFVSHGGDQRVFPRSGAHSHPRHSGQYGDFCNFRGYCAWVFMREEVEPIRYWVQILLSLFEAQRLHEVPLREMPVGMDR